MAYQLVADIGGTNARFAFCDEGSTVLQNIQVFHCAQFDSPIEAIAKYLSTNSVSIESACLAVAGPVNETDDFVKLTNNPWSFSQNQLASRFDGGRLIVINDFVAAAMATTVIHPDDLFSLSKGLRFNLEQQRCILGPGTGLGVAGMLPYREKTLVLSTEGGNRSFSPENEIEDYILQFLRSELQVVSCEALLSGNGLVNIYRALCSYHKQTADHSKADDISAAAFKKDPMAHQALQTFFEILGSVAGDCALTLGATGGVYIGGGIAPKFSEALLESKFRERFENKLNYSFYLKKIPTAIVMHQYPGLLGAAAYLNSI
ncbi:MAG: glucokinase [Lentimonas sp.]|jgi:glucokinase